VKLAIEFTGPGPLIFRSVRHPRKPLSDSTISKAYREAGFSGVHVPHGWRSTFSTVMNELAAVENRLGDRAIIDLMLAHVPAGVEAAYNRAGYMPRRRVLAQEWADMLTAGLAEPASLLTGPRQHG
jgi:integrase